MSKLDDLILEINSTTFQGEHGLIHTLTYEYLKQKTKHLFLELMNEAAISTNDPTVNDYDEDGAPIIYVHKLLEKVNEL